MTPPHWPQRSLVIIGDQLASFRHHRNWEKRLWYEGEIGSYRKPLTNLPEGRPNILTSRLSVIFPQHTIDSHKSKSSSSGTFAPHHTMTTTVTLTAWAESHLGALYDSSAPQASDDTAFRTAFDGLFSPHVQIITNHEPMTRDELLDMIRSRAAATVATTTEWKDVIEIPKADGDSQKVCLFA